MLMPQVIEKLHVTKTKFNTKISFGQQLCRIRGDLETSFSLRLNSLG